MAIAPIMQTSASGSSAKGVTASQYEMYNELIKGNYDPVTAASMAGISPDLAAKLVQTTPNASYSAEVLGLKALADEPAAEGTATSRQKELQAYREKVDAASSSGTTAKSSLESLENLKEANEGASVFTGTLGPGIAPALVRTVKGALSGVVDVGAGSMTDLQNLDASSVQAIKDVASGWSGAISNYENQLFKTAAPGPDKTPEYNAQVYAAAIGTAAQVKVFDTMLTEVNGLRAETDPLTPSNAIFSANNRKIAMEWIAKKSGLTFKDLQPTDPNYLKYAQEWDQYANTSANAGQIREAILRVRAASKLGLTGVDGLDDRRVTEALGLENVIDPNAQNEAPPTTDLNKIDASTDVAGQAGEAQATAKDDAIVQSAAAQGTAEGLEQFATTDYTDGKTALAAIQQTLTATGKAPTSVKIKGRVVTLNSFADATAASKFIDDLRAAKQPVPPVVIIGGQIFKTPKVK
jgi:hypothetical protein